jgi:DNA-binding CsgD family transcriptional regulator
LAAVAVSRILRNPGDNARVTRIGDRLLLVSVPIEANVEMPGVSSLTAAEREVAELAARGLSGVAIARKRGCSPRTVANHMAAVYRKLGVGSRRELRVRFGS